MSVLQPTTTPSAGKMKRAPTLYMLAAPRKRLAAIKLAKRPKVSAAKVSCSYSFRCGVNYGV